MLRTIAICIILLFAATVPVRAQPAPSHPATAAHTRATAAQPSVTSSLAANQFSSEQAAKGHCSGDAVVWVNLGGSKAYHTSDNKYYGKTKHGAFMCQRDADQSGFHAAGRRASKTAPKNTSAKTAK